MIGRRSYRDLGVCRGGVITVYLAAIYSHLKRWVGGTPPEYLLVREIVATVAHEDLHAALDLRGRNATRYEHRLIARALDWTGYHYRG